MAIKPPYYKKIGSGPKSLILFHGFGQDHTVFTDWDIHTNAYTIYAFDLYNHGKSPALTAPLSKTEWKNLFSGFLEKEQISNCSIVAFSLGGRFGLISAFLFPQVVTDLILIAPDGIFKNPWYKLAVHPLLNPVFKHLMMHPSRFNQLLNFSSKLHLATSSSIRFADRQLRSSENRTRVYLSWTYFDSLIVPIKQLVSVFNKNQVAVDLILGEKDSVIPPSKVAPKMQSIHILNTHIIACSHHKIIGQSKSLVKSILNTSYPQGQKQK